MIVIDDFDQRSSLFFFPPVRTMCRPGFKYLNEESFSRAEYRWKNIFTYTCSFNLFLQAGI